MVMGTTAGLGEGKAGKLFLVGRPAREKGWAPSPTPPTSSLLVCFVSTRYEHVLLAFFSLKVRTECWRMINLISQVLFQNSVVQFDNQLAIASCRNKGRVKSQLDFWESGTMALRLWPTDSPSQLSSSGQTAWLYLTEADPKTQLPCPSLGTTSTFHINITRNIPNTRWGVGKRHLSSTWTGMSLYTQQNKTNEPNKSLITHGRRSCGSQKQPAYFYQRRLSVGLVSCATCIRRSVPVKARRTLKAGTNAVLLVMGNPLQTADTGLHVDFAGNFTCSELKL